MNLQADSRQLEEVAEPVAPGVARVRPAVFRSFKTVPQDAPSPQPPQEGPASRRSVAQRAYQPAPRPSPAPETPAKLTAPSARSSSTVKSPIAITDWETQLAPLRALSRELVGRGLPAGLVTELIAEIVGEYGNQVLESEQDARWALVEQILLRTSGDPLIPATGPIGGSYVIAGPTGSGRSVLVAAIGLAAVKRGQTDMLLVNTEVDRIGATAQMDALGKVFNCRVAHAYSPDELRDLHSSCSGRTLLLAQASGWAPTTMRSCTKAPSRGHCTARKRCCVCRPRRKARTCSSFSPRHDTFDEEPACRALAHGQTRNVLPSIGALACAREPVGMIVRGQSLTQQAVAPSLATIVRTALGVTLSPRKRG